MPVVKCLPNIKLGSISLPPNLYAKQWKITVHTLFYYYNEVNTYNKFLRWHDINPNTNNPWNLHQPSYSVYCKLSLTQWYSEFILVSQQANLVQFQAALCALIVRYCTTAPVARWTLEHRQTAVNYTNV